MAGLLYYSNPAAVATSLRGASPAWLLLAIAVVIVDRVANAYRWLLLLRAIEPGRHIAVGAAIRVFFVSGFIGSFLPGSVGGDAVRTLALSKLQVPPADAFASVVVDRMLGVASVLLMAAGSLVIVGRLFDRGALAAMWISVGAFLLIFLLLLFDSRLLTGAMTWLLGRRFPALHRVLSRALAAIRQYGEHRQTLVVVLGLSIGVQVLRTLQAWTLGQALGIEAGLVWYFAFLPVIILVMLLPTSVAGLGTGALAFQLLFGTIGVPPAASFALAVLFSALSIVGTLPGGLMLAFERRQPQRADDGRAQRERFK
jgi:uncharacterized protein (TIRG00374 family)